MLTVITRPNYRLAIPAYQVAYHATCRGETMGFLRAGLLARMMLLPAFTSHLRIAIIDRRQMHSAAFMLFRKGEHYMHRGFFSFYVYEW